MNTFINQLDNHYTENGGLAHSEKVLNNEVYALFAFGAAYRKRSDEDCILLFKNAIEENVDLAMKCLFYIRDILHGQGERRFFRVCYKWLIENYPEIAKKNLIYIPSFGRWDDLIYICLGSQLHDDMVNIVSNQLLEDTETKAPSLLAKWMPSINAANAETKKAGKLMAKSLKMTQENYRKTLSVLRKKINVLERLMSDNDWEKIEFDKIPSLAGLKYRDVFATKESIREKYKEFILNKNTKVNANALYPYDIVKKAISLVLYNDNSDKVKREAINKYWENQKDYLKGSPSKMLCVIDTSGSMSGLPINVAISLGLYCAERLGGDFHNKYINFNTKPTFYECIGIDFCDKVERIYRNYDWGNTDLEAVFRLVGKAMANSKEEDWPTTICVISDMEIDEGSIQGSTGSLNTMMENMRKEYERNGLKMPRLVYWNVDARQNNILDNGDSNITYVSGCSPILFESVLTGKNGWDLCLEILLSNRYKEIGGVS